jgi:hypothetical protein
MRRCSLFVLTAGLTLSVPHAHPACAQAPTEEAFARPSEESAQELAKRLLQAIIDDQPEAALDTFFPRAAFVQVKAMQKPERYYDKLRARFVADIHALHERTPELAHAQFVKLVLGSRGGWVRPGEEGNRLPYWAARHALLHYRVAAVTHTLELRVLISWQQRWYVIHLSEFH